METEARREQQRRWYVKNRQKVIALNRRWAQDHPERKRIARRKWAALNPEKARESARASAERHRDRRNERHRLARSTPEGKRKDKNCRLKADYGITHEQYDAMLEAQGGVCAICRKLETRVIRGIPTPLTVDHDHATGAVRKLLCHRCNASIGFLDENPDRMRAMAAYIEAHARRAEDFGA